MLTKIATKENFSKTVESVTSCPVVRCLAHQALPPLTDTPWTAELAQEQVNVDAWES